MSLVTRSKRNSFWLGTAIFGRHSICATHRRFHHSHPQLIPAMGFPRLSTVYTHSSQYLRRGVYSKLTEDSLSQWTYCPSPHSQPCLDSSPRLQLVRSSSGHSLALGWSSWTWFALLYDVDFIWPLTLALSFSTPACRAEGIATCNKFHTFVAVSQWGWPSWWWRLPLFNLLNRPRATWLKLRHLRRAHTAPVRSDSLQENPHFYLFVFMCVSAL